MVGTGIFTGTGYLAKDLGSPNLILLIWVVGGICAFLGAICYSELGINFPSSGGEYVYLTRAFGTYGEFMTGVFFFAGFSAPIAAAALAFSEYGGFATIRNLTRYRQATRPPRPRGVDGVQHRDRADADGAGRLPGARQACSACTPTSRSAG